MFCQEAEQIAVCIGALTPEKPSRPKQEPLVLGIADCKCNNASIHALHFANHVASHLTAHLRLWYPPNLESVAL